MSQPRTVRTAIVGLGLGTFHANKVLKNPDATLCAVADLDATRLETFAPQIGAEHCHTDFREMLAKEKPDLTVIALPNVLHRPATLAALEAGSHVLCEKPMAMNVAECLEMRAAARRLGLTLGINLSYRFNPKSRACKDLADAGCLGHPYHAYTTWTRRDGFPGFGGWFGRKELSGGGPLIDLGVHRLDLAIWLMGNPEPLTASAQIHHHIGRPRAESQNKPFDVEDLAAGFVRFANGASLVFEISWAGHQEDDEPMLTRVMGDRGTLIQRNAGSGHAPVAVLATTVAGHPVTSQVHPKGSFRESIDEMIHCIQTGDPFLVSADDGIRIQRVLDGLYESARLGREVELVPIPE